MNNKFVKLRKSYRVRNFRNGYQGLGRRTDYASRATLFCKDDKLNHTSLPPFELS